MLLAGVYFPPEVLPVSCSSSAPGCRKHTLDAARLVLSGQASLGDASVRDNLMYLAQFAVVTFSIGLLLFI